MLTPNALNRLGDLIRGAAQPYPGYALALDFKNGIYRAGGLVTRDVTALAGYSYARSGAKAELDANGVPVSFASGVPGIVPGVGFWSRSAVTNVLLWSQQFDKWGATALSVIADQTVSPDGGLTADLLVPSTSSAEHFAVMSTGTTTAGQAITGSVFVKSAGYNYAVVDLYGTGTSGDRYAVFDLTAGTVTDAASGVTAAITPGAHGFWRICVTITPTVSGGAGFYLFPSTGSTYAARVFAGDGTQGVYAWQAQLVAGTQPVPIIPTTSAAATVGADNLVVGEPITTDQDFAFLVTVNYPAAATANQVISEASDGSGSNRFTIYRTGGSGQLAAYIAAANASVGPSSPSTAISIGRGVALLRRRAGKWTLAGRDASGSVAIGTETGVTAFGSLSQLNVGGSVASSNPADNPIEFAGIRKGTFSDADLTAMLGAA